MECIMDTEHAAEALSGHEYYDSIVLHRKNFIFKGGIDYDTHHPHTISFLPPEEVWENYKSDYAQMKEQMIYDDNAPEFETLIKRLNDLLIQEGYAKATSEYYCKELSRYLVMNWDAKLEKRGLYALSDIF